MRFSKKDKIRDTAIKVGRKLGSKRAKSAETSDEKNTRVEKEAKERQDKEAKERQDKEIKDITANHKSSKISTKQAYREERVNSKIAKIIEKHTPKLEKEFPDFRFPVSYKQYHHIKREKGGEKGLATLGMVEINVYAKNNGRASPSQMEMIKAFTTKKIVPLLFKEGLFINRVWVYNVSLNFSCSLNPKSKG